MITSRAKPRAFSRLRYVVVICVVVLFAAVAAWFLRQPGKVPETPPTSITKTVAPPEQNVIDYNKLRSREDKTLTSMMNERKTDYGLKNSIDMVVKTGETIRVGDQVVSMQRIADQIRIKLHEIVESDLAGEEPVDKETFGVYVAKAGDNIWNVHFNLLKEYFRNKDIVLSPKSDEPDDTGYSSGVAKILKFSEKLVHVYNLKTDRLSANVSLIDPLQKVVVYNMKVIFELLDQFDYEEIDRLEFDGETLWIPQESGH